MKHHDGRITATGGRGLFYQVWEPDSPADALLLLVHGAGEHSGRYRALASWFCARGFTVAAIDHSGHGRSQGRPGYVESFNVFVDDLAAFHRHVTAGHAQLPQFIVGHSLGGLIAAHYLLRQQASFSGAIFSGPLVSVEPAPGLLQQAIIRLLARAVPRLGILQIDPQGVSRDPNVVAAYTADPLVFHGRMSARQLREMFDAMARLRREVDRITLPLLVLHGEQDQLAAPAGSRFLAAAAGSRDTTLKIYPGLQHEIFNEPE
ncbi:MAG: lysophospholipase, partial [Halioglobus sp.]|nr:lysophospholipase [Halioglobus sp.]